MKRINTLPLRPICLYVMVWSVVVEEILRPRRQLLVAFVEVPAIVAKRARASRSVADSPYCGAPYVAVCAPPGLSLAALC